MRRSVLIACVVLGAAAFASTTLYSVEMTTRRTPERAAPLPPVNQVLYQHLPDGVELGPDVEAGYLPYYGYAPLAAAGYGGRIVPAPLLASAPGYVPTLIRPVAPPAVELRMRHPGGGVTIRPYTNIYTYYIPRSPLFRTNGTAVYGVPNESAVYLYNLERQRRHHRR